MCYAAILLSRQKLHPSFSCNWVRAALEAVKWAGAHRLTLFTSIGMQTWELLLFCASYFNINQCIVVPATTENSFVSLCAWIKTNFNVKSSYFKFLPIPENSSEDFSTERDSYIMGHSDIILPVSVRKGGGMASFVQRAKEVGKTIIEDFKIPYESGFSLLKYQIPSDNLNKELNSLGGKYLFHWTHSPHTSWPGETRASYYAAVLSSPRYPRTAFDTLKRIISTGVIFGSTTHVVKNQKVVSFTGSSPLEFVSLMRWRKRYKKMSFEPYGIGINVNLASELGVRPVVYTDKKMRTDIMQSWLLQTKGRKGNWIEENEYRYRGDLYISTIPKSELICICLYESQAQIMQKLFSIRSYCFQMDKHNDNSSNREQNENCEEIFQIE